MAKKSAIDKNKKRIHMVEQHKDKRAALKKVIKDKNVSQEDRFKAVLKLAALPKNGSKIRIRNRCEVQEDQEVIIVNLEWVGSHLEI